MLRKYITYKEFLEKPLIFNKYIYSLKKDKQKIATTYFCADTETSTDKINGWIYQWAFGYDDTIVFGRRPSDMIKCFKKISDCANDKTVKIFFHNMSYDIQYLKNFIFDIFDKSTFNMLAVDNHQFISFKIENIEIYDSYILANRSLYKWGKDLCIPHLKKAGLIDYKKIRHQDTSLTYEDWKYLAFDIISLQECIEKEMAIHNDNIATICLTSTGYVRREIKKNFRKDKKGQKIFNESQFSDDINNLMCEAFYGGLSLGNINKNDKLIKGKMRHRDFRSHYPSELRMYNYPVGNWIYSTEYNGSKKLDKLLNDSENYGFLVDITILNPKLKDNVSMCFLQITDIIRNKITDITNIRVFNGRVKSCVGAFELVFIESDLKILSMLYEFDYYINYVFYAKKEPTPKYLQATIDEFYYNKTKFKELTRTEPHNNEHKIDLMKSKNLLNGIYGCCATRIIKQNIKMRESGEWYIETQEKTNNQLIDDFFNKRNGVLYQYGVWCTGYARLDLVKKIMLVGFDNFLYCDTDSIFYISNDEIEKKLEEENKRMKKAALERGAYIEYNNEKYTYFSFDDENENITEFKYLHSKCYGYVADNELNVVIAGVNPVGINNITRERELKRLDNLKHSYTFNACGGTRCKYVESAIFINEYGDEVSSAAIILNVQKTLSNKFEKSIKIK